MNDNLILIFAILISALIGAYLSMRFTKLKSKSEKSTLEERETQLNNIVTELKNTITNLEAERDKYRDEKEGLNLELVQKNTEYENLQKQNLLRDKELEERQKQLRKDFELLATKILDEKSEKFTLKNKENIKNILAPLQEKIKDFEKKVDDSQKESIGMHSALKTQLENLKTLNQQMSKEAINLTKALKGDSKAQGNWGEIVLENVLEKSGLEKNREYFVQQSFTLENGSRVLPDVVINLPDNKKMVVDSKVSLTAYEQYTSSEGKETQKKFLKEHVKSIKNHITELSNKKYEDLYKIESPDFVLMFIPIEPALYLAQNEDKNFFYTAFNKNILLVSPTTLLSTLRTIDAIWKNEKQQQNAVEIAKHATSLYSKFKNLLDDLEIVGNRIKSTGTAYEGAMKKLTGNQNLIKDIDKLDRLGIQPKEKISKKWLERANGNKEQALSENIIKRARENNE
jgi:DNA recombination protein RmuC